MEILIALIISVFGSLVAGFLSGWVSREAKFRKRYEYAAKSYSSCLGKMIKKAGSSPDKMVEINSRAIVKMRNDFRRALSNLSEHLNSEIDKLEKLLKQLKRADTTENYQFKILEEMKITIRVLDEIWPSKAEIIDRAVRKVIVDLGLEPF